MSTPAQIAANIANAQSSTGPRTETGKATSAKNGITLGLFTATDFIRPSEQETYAELQLQLNCDLAPVGVLETTLVDEIRRATWKLRRCAQVEANLANSADDDTLDPLESDDTRAEKIQRSVDRARAQAHRLLHKCTAELRKLQTERHFRNEYFEAGTDLSHLGISDFTQVRKGIGREISNGLRQHKLDEINEMAAAFKDNRQHVAAITRQTQSPAQTLPQTTPQTPRNASCPCNSGQKYKRCCGKNASAILHAA